MTALGARVLTIHGWGAIMSADRDEADVLLDAGYTMPFRVDEMHPTAPPTMPAPAQRGLPDAVVAILRQTHADHVRMALYYHRESATQSVYILQLYIRDTKQHLAAAAAIRTALIDAGHTDEATELLAATAALTVAMERAAWPHPITEAA